METQDGNSTYHVALAFMRCGDDGGEIVACDPKEARSSDQAVRLAEALAKREGHCGGIAFARPAIPLSVTSRTP